MIILFELKRDVVYFKNIIAISCLPINRKKLNLMVRIESIIMCLVSNIAELCNSLSEINIA